MRRSIPLLAAMLLLATACQSTRQNASGSGAERHVRFTYTATVTDYPAGTSELALWIPKPRTDLPEQTVHDARIEVSEDAQVEEARDATFGNRFWLVRVPHPEGPIVATATVDVTRREHQTSFRGAGARALTVEERTTLAEHLRSNIRVPVEGRLAGLASTIDPGEGNTVVLARRLYDHVYDGMRYSKEGEGWGQGDSLWACDAGYGNCTDFHSLFMSLARARGIPTRFTMGFPLPPERGTGKVGGYHCWAEFYVPETGWTPVDISEADKHPELAEYYFGNLTEDRIAFTQGRDLEIVPGPSNGPINFFIYPVAEADGKPVEAARAFAFTDV